LAQAGHPQAFFGHAKIDRKMVEETLWSSESTGSARRPALGLDGMQHVLIEENATAVCSRADLCGGHLVCAAKVGPSQICAGQISPAKDCILQIRAAQVRPA
jgi:hypothetical protein